MKQFFSQKITEVKKDSEGYSCSRCDSACAYYCRSGCSASCTSLSAVAHDIAGRSR